MLQVMEAVKVLRSEYLPMFNSQVESAVTALVASPPGAVDENEFIDASRLVYDGVREIRRAVLMNRGEEEIDTDTEWDDFDETSDIGSNRPLVESRQEDLIDEFPEISGITTARDAMKQLPEAERIKILEQVEEFRSERVKFDREVSKWDDQGNDVIVLAKHMCMIMMEMTDFTRGRGHLKTTMDVISAAKRISEAGTKLDKLARAIADRCVESTTKKDLIAYLQRIALYCHQLNITSKVKADVHNVSGELIVSGLDSAMSLIQAAKNLMNAVVLTVKASYVACRMYKQTRDTCHAPDEASTCPPSPIVVWKMRTPEKKPLVRREHPEEFRARIRRGASTKQTSPLKALSEFEQRTPCSLSTSSSVSSVGSVLDNIHEK